MIRWILVLFLLSPCFGAIQAGMQWDVRSTGSDTSGGGFDNTVAAPGTDFSTQDAAQQAYTDLIIGATATQLTSALHAFGATHPGNVINITGGAGCTVGWYEVLSVAGVTATMDRSVGTAASTCTGNLGGGLATPAKVFTLMVNQNIAHLKSATYTFTSTLTMPNVQFTLRGYQTAHNDYGAQPLITTATNIDGMHTGGSSTVAFLDNIGFTITVSSDHSGISTSAAANIYLANFYCAGWGYSCIEGGSDVSTAFRTVTAWNSEFTNNGINHGRAAITNTGPIVVDRGYFHANYTDIACPNISAGTTIAVDRSIFKGYTHQSVFYTANGNLSFVAQHSVWYTSSATSAVNLNANGYLSLVNCVFYGISAGTALAINAASSQTYMRNCAFGNNQHDHTNMPAGPGEITLSADPFTSGSTGDFSLNATAGGGASLKNAAYPLTPAGLAANTYDDVNALRHQDPAGGGSTKGFTFSLLMFGGLSALGVVALRRAV